MPTDESIQDELHVILQQESTKYYAKKFNCFSLNNNPNNRHNQVNEIWRQKICEWLFKVVDHFDFDREVVLIAINYIDRVISIEVEKTRGKIDRKQFQLLSITCFYIAMKLHGETSNIDADRCKLTMKIFVDFSRGLLTDARLEAKELEVLEALEWHVNPPSPCQIIACLLHFLPKRMMLSQIECLKVKVKIFETSRYLLEMGMCVSTIAFNYKPSELACACILCALDSLMNDIPDDIRLLFGKNIIASIDDTQAVKSLKTSLKDLCPSMFCGQEDEHSICSTMMKTLEYSFDEEDEFESTSSRKQVMPIGSAHHGLCVQAP